ncbi:MAG: squalene--hopene cyclase [Planctomycetota bacterium]|nr:MAG: squalene--hopene cyclase [Planctomycetota bacterium]
MSPAAATATRAPAVGVRTPPMSIDARARSALDAGVEALLAKQHDDGHWCAELEGDSILNSEYLLMKAILGQHAPDAAEGATERDRALHRKILAYLRMLQRADGSWGQYPGAAMDLSATVKGYFALKIWGEDPQAPHMRRARQRILEAGGAERINTFSMFYLACLGQVSWDACPAIPLQIALLPRWFPFHMDKVAAWTRTMILPLAICSALRPVRQIDPRLGIDELFVDPRARGRLCKPWDRDNPVSWANTFIAVDTALKVADRLGLTPMRRAALERAEAWLLERMDPETTDGLGAIFPPMVYIQVALQALGYARDHPVRRTAECELDRFIVEEADHARIQPCFSPVWDTGIALYALTEAGLDAGAEPRLARTLEWLCDREVRLTGDWVRNLRPRDRSIRLGVDAAAWAFEHRNDWYPDVDDTAMVAKAMRRAVRPITLAPASDPSIAEPVGRASGPSVAARAFDASQRATRWILAMQNDDGGWAAFDRTKDRRWLEAVPFADHNAMQDPSCPDITGRTIEALTTCGVPRDHPAVRRAVAYLWRTQRPEGWWPGRWGVNAVYGVWQAVGGLHAAGESRDPRLLKTTRWLRSIQNADGGFGETADSYEDPRWIGVGPSTASQTAWGAMALMYLAGARDRAVERAIAWFCDHQLNQDCDAEPPAPLDISGLHPAQIAWATSEDRPPVVASHPVPEPAGAWREAWFTGTGFPKVFYLRYHLYRHYFPVMALARFLRLRHGRIGS